MFVREDDYNVESYAASAQRRAICEGLYSSGKQVSPMFVQPFNYVGLMCIVEFLFGERQSSDLWRLIDDFVQHLGGGRRVFLRSNRRPKATQIVK